MATSSSYYINAPSLGSATAVFTDSALLICATDGFYSDGVISREQVGCVLLPQQTCPSCATPCGVNISASGTQGIYLLNLDTGTAVGDIGAVIVRFDPFSVPDGIRGTLGANVYNKLTSSVDGLHESTNAGAFTYVGSTGADCGISGTTYPALIEYLYDGTAFYATGNTQSVTVAPGDVSLGAFAPGNCLMVIPKTTASPSIINFEIVGPCSGTAWDMSVACPVLLTGFSSSVMAASSAAVCLLSETVTYYNASLPNTPGIVGLYDFVYSDAYGSTQLPAGFYLATGSIIGGNDWFEVDADGVVIDLGICIPVSYNCISGVCTDPGDGSATSGHFTTTATITANNCSGPVSVSGTLTSVQGPLIILVPSVPSGSTATIVAQGIGATNAVITTGVVSGILRIIITPNSYPSTVTLNGTLTVTFVPPVVSYNCVSGVCTDPGDGSGTYATLGACQAACFPVTYNCVSGVCTDPGDGTGTYATLGACQAACFPVTYNCVSGVCTDPGDGTGTYATLGACQAVCFPVTYNCISGVCTDPGDGTGTYATLGACQAACPAATNVIMEVWNNVAGICQYQIGMDFVVIPGNSPNLGQYYASGIPDVFYVPTGFTSTSSSTNFTFVGGSIGCP